jgi:hypothetical protein
VLKQLETLPIVTRRKDSAMPSHYGMNNKKKNKKTATKKTNGKKLTKKQMSLPPSLRKKIMRSM